MYCNNRMQIKLTQVCVVHLTFVLEYIHLINYWINFNLTTKKQRVSFDSKLNINVFVTAHNILR